MSTTPYIARVAGEAFDADQIEQPCDCGFSQYSCQCETLTQDELIDDAIAALQNEGFDDEAAAIIAIRAEVALARSLVGNGVAA